jgi:serine protease Do
MSAVLEAAPHAPAVLGLPAEIVARVTPSIVRIRGRGPAGAAGIAWRRDAVVTNHHVVAGAGHALRVIDAGDRPHAARAVEVSPELDLAILEVSGADLQPAAIGASRHLRIGALVFAVGHPWGHPWVVTAGIVSGLGELAGPDRGRPRAYIRSDVRLAPGNSGGALLDARGDVVGVNAMVVGGDLALAIPSDVVRGWLEARA